MARFASLLCCWLVGAVSSSKFFRLKIQGRENNCLLPRVLDRLLVLHVLRCDSDDAAAWQLRPARINERYHLVGRILGRDLPVDNQLRVEWHTVKPQVFQTLAGRFYLDEDRDLQLNFREDRFIRGRGNDGSVIGVDETGKVIDAMDVAEVAPFSVAVGDSFISGDGGRWRGNSENGRDEWFGTDRGENVYGESGSCLRSNSAPIITANVGSWANLACTGAVSADVYKPGGQAELLGQVASLQTVSAIMVSVGGNDLGFEEILFSCAESYLKGVPCRTQQQTVLESRMDFAAAEVRRALRSIRSTMESKNYSSADYRLILQSYPSPIPNSSSMRFQSDPGASRWEFGGCPFSNVDLDWARDKLIPQISSMLRNVAIAENVEFLDVQHLFDGHEVCASAVSQAQCDEQDESTLEWVRHIWPGFTDANKPPPAHSKGLILEFLHPNFLGQVALGTCFSKHIQAGVSKSAACYGAPGMAPSDVVIIKQAD